MYLEIRTTEHQQVLTVETRMNPTGAMARTAGPRLECERMAKLQMKKISLMTLIQIPMLK